MEIVRSVCVDRGEPVAGGSEIYGWVTLLLLVASAVGGFFQAWTWVVALGLLAALSTYAGLRLQMEKDARESPTFTVRLERERGTDIPAGAGHVFDQTRLWAVVDNRGPAAEFSARVRDVTGIEHSGDYRVDGLAWEYGREEARHLIERGNQARVRIGVTWREGKVEDPKMALRFFIPHPGMWGDGTAAGQGVGMQLTHGTRVTFQLDVLNVTADAERICRVLLTCQDDGTVADFRIM